VRLRKFLNGDYVRKIAREDHLASIQLMLRTCWGMRRVVFDPRLYMAESLRDVGPQELRSYLLDLENRGVHATPAAEPTSVTAKRDGQWNMIHILGVAVVGPADVQRVRTWSRLALPPSEAWRPAGAFEGFDPRHIVPGVMHEASSPGIYTLAKGLRVGEEELRRLRTGVQAAAPESIFMAPLRLSL
jgi:hypothetical protein